jgi:uncharacterized membrane protein YfcA
MEIYLPIAEIPLNIFLILIIGFGAGLLSGIFGIGGGFIMTPLLIFLGVPPAISVSTSANQIIASSFSAFLAHWRRKNIDFKMGFILIIGGFFGSTFGVWLFGVLKDIGQIDIVISLSYVIILGSISISMAVESFSKIFNWRKVRDNQGGKKKKKESRLPLQMYFPRSNITISWLIPIIVSFFAGILVSIMGIGGGFIMIPAMIYIIGMPTSVVIGTSLFQVIFITANVTFLQSVTTQTVDIVLASILFTSSVIGAQFGTRLGTKISAEKMRAILALMVLAVVIKLLMGLLIEPVNPYEIILVE